MKKLYLGLALAALLGLSGCALITPPNEYKGNTALINYNQASVDALIKDGQTTRAQINAVLGRPAFTPDGQPFEIYIVNVIDYTNSVAYNKSVSVNFDKNDVATDHKFTESRSAF